MTKVGLYTHNEHKYCYCCMNNEHSPTSCVSVSIVSIIITDLSLCDRNNNGANVLIVVLFLNC